MVRKGMKQNRVAGQRNTQTQDEQIEIYDLQSMLEGFLMEQSCRGNANATVEYSQEKFRRFITYL